MTHPPFFDNKANIVKDDLVSTIRSGDRVSVAAEVFSMYAYQELREQLDRLEEFRFIFTSQAFTKSRSPKQEREFYIPRLAREKGLCGTQLEIRLRNELTQKSVASECARWIRSKAKFRSFGVDNGMDNTFLVVDGPEGTAAYTPFAGLTTAELGVDNSSGRQALVMRPDASTSRALLGIFDEAWDSGQLDDVTDAVVDSITAMYKENPPELVYYMALYRIFSEFLDDVSEDVLPKEGTGFRESAIWGKLYDFQRDAAIAIINKLETFDGCILADSVGLGKTFTALAVIKYYESRNRNVLVLCPKKLRDNWTTYNRNVVNNPIASDRLRYDVLYHTDLSRERGMSETMGVDLSRVNWGNYDLVVIDESHNFRNGGDSATDDRLNRYQILMEKVIKEGVRTKVLMLSATPVNNRFRDLRNQLALAYQGDPESWSARLGLSTDVETVFRNAQSAYTAWSKLPVGQKDHRKAPGHARLRLLRGPRPGDDCPQQEAHPAVLRHGGARAIPEAPTSHSARPQPLDAARRHQLPGDLRGARVTHALGLHAQRLPPAQQGREVRGPGERQPLRRRARDRHPAPHDHEPPQAPRELRELLQAHARARALLHGADA